MALVIQLMGIAPNGRPPPVVTYVRDVDFDADEGRGRIIMTQKLDEAKRFASTREALDYYRTASKVVPIRPDGQPNRPLTASNVQIYKDTMPAA